MRDPAWLEKIMEEAVRRVEKWPEAKMGPHLAEVMGLEKRAASAEQGCSAPKRDSE